MISRPVTSATAAHSESPTADAPPELVLVADDVDMERVRRRYATRNAVVVFMAALVAAYVVAVVVGSVLGQGAHFVAGMIAFYAVMALAGLVLFVKARGHQSAFENALRAGATQRDLWCEVMAFGMPRVYRVGHHSLARALASFGQTNRAVCFAKLELLPAIEPFQVTFEARAVDECVGGFDELQAAQGRDAFAAETPPPAGGLAFLRPPRWAARNTATWGGYRVMVPIGILLAYYALATFVLGRESETMLLCVAVLLAAMFLIPSRKMTPWSVDWYVAPGAVIVRRNRPFQKGVELKVYDRRTSVLVAATFEPRQWYLTAADAGELGDFR